jgi:hypothetical protein
MIKGKREMPNLEVISYLDDLNKDERIVESCEQA